LITQIIFEIDLPTGAKAFSRGLYKIGECIRAWQKVVAKSQKHRGIGVSIADLRNASNRVWSCRQFGKTGCLEEEILAQCIIFTRYLAEVSTIVNYCNKMFKNLC